MAFCVDDDWLQLKKYFLNFSQQTLINESLRSKLRFQCNFKLSDAVFWSGTSLYVIISLTYLQYRDTLVKIRDQLDKELFWYHTKNIYCKWTTKISKNRRGFSTALPSRTPCWSSQRKEWLGHVRFISGVASPQGKGEGLATKLTVGSRFPFKQAVCK